MDKLQRKEVKKMATTIDDNGDAAVRSPGGLGGGD